MGSRPAAAARGERRGVGSASLRWAPAGGAGAPCGLRGLPSVTGFCLPGTQWSRRAVCVCVCMVVLCQPLWVPRTLSYPPGLSWGELGAFRELKFSFHFLTTSCSLVEKCGVVCERD